MIKGGGWKSPESVKGNYNHGSEVFKNDHKPKRYGEDALNKVLLGKKVKITLINNQTVEGVFSNIGMYDITVITKVIQTFTGVINREIERPVIVLKSAIATLEVIE